MCATFGDTPAGLMLEAAKRRAADLGEEIDEEAARQIREVCTWTTSSWAVTRRL